VLERYAYDPWGRRLNPTDWKAPDTRTTWRTNRGYTGHEHLDAFGIINMNGRVYDPATAMFLSPDPFVQEPGNWINYNRYGYCMNNPTNATDPSGYKYWNDTFSMTEEGRFIMNSWGDWTLGSSGGGGGGGIGGWYNYWAKNASEFVGVLSIEEVKKLYEMSMEEKILNPYARYLKVTGTYQVDLTYGNETKPYCSYTYTQDFYYRLPDEDPTERDLADLRGEKYDENNSEIVKNFNRSTLDILALAFEKSSKIKGLGKASSVLFTYFDLDKYLKGQISESELYEGVAISLASEAIAKAIGGEFGIGFSLLYWGAPIVFDMMMKPISKYLMGCERELQNMIITTNITF